MRISISKLDKLVSEIVRDKGYCEYCKKRFRPSDLHPHHFYSRSNIAIRWDLDNLFALCPEHHTISTEFSAHKTPKKFKEWAIKDRGEDWNIRLTEKSMNTFNWSDEELKNIYDKLKKDYFL